MAVNVVGKSEHKSFEYIYPLLEDLWQNQDCLFRFETLYRSLAVALPK